MMMRRIGDGGYGGRELKVKVKVPLKVKAEVWDLSVWVVLSAFGLRMCRA